MRPRPALGWTVAWAGSAALAVLAAHEPASARAAATVLASGAVVTCIGAWAARSDRGAGIWMGALVAGGALAGLYDAAQYAYMPLEGKLTIAEGWRRGGLAVPRLAAWAPMANSMATLLEGPLCSALVLAVAGRPRMIRLAAGLSASSMAVAIALTASRGAWVAVVVALAFALLAAASDRYGGRRVVALGAVGTALAIVAWIVLPGLVVHRPDRLAVYADSLAMLEEFPFTGIGPGDQFAGVLSRNVLLIQVPFLTYSHNLYLDIWLEQGLPGLMAWTGLVVALAIAVIARERRGSDAAFRAGWVALVAVLAHGVTDARQSVDPWTTWIPWFALVGLVSARSSSSLAGRRISLLSAGIVLAAVLAWRAPVRAAWEANLGAVAEARARLGTSPSADGLGAARAHFDRAIALDPAQITAHRRLGVIATEEGDFEAAVPHLAAAWRADPSRRTAKAYGLALTWHGDVERASLVLRDVPAMVQELVAWASWREQRGEPVLAAHAQAVASRLRALGAS